MGKNIYIVERKRMLHLNMDMLHMKYLTNKIVRFPEFRNALELFLEFEDSVIW